MKTMPEPYRLADLALSQLTQAAARIEQRTKRRLLIEGFDELNVMQRIDSMYAEIDKEFRETIRSLWILRYREVCEWLDHDDDEDIIDELVEMHLAGLLGEPNETTHYVYDTEFLRKRDRAKEAVLSVPTKTQKQLEMDKQLRHMMQMVAWYVDFTAQDAEIEAFDRTGVKKVKRHEMKDAKTCRECREADGEVYPIDAIPPLPHPRCRRWFTPAD